MLDNQIQGKIALTKEVDKSDLWTVEPSFSALNCRNFIREIVDNLDLKPNPEKQVIALSIGDPTVYNNLPQSTATLKSIHDILDEGTCNGYAPSTGYDHSRQAVAQYLSHSGAQYHHKDIVLCSGCSSSIELCITALCCPKKNHNILVPRPGFPIYRTLAESIGVAVKYYNLQPEKDWEVDLYHLESQIDHNTAAIVLNNPSNPCGSVYTEHHLKAFLDIALKYKVPVIADEIYERIVFPGHKFVSVAALNSTVPILVCGGLAKRFLVPGWRLGWIALYDPLGAFTKIRKALIALSQRTIGSNTLVQGALPGILFNTPQEYHDGLIAVLKKNAHLVFERLKLAKGLFPYLPQGTMYMVLELQMFKFPFSTGLAFAQKLMEEESVFCLPGECFQIPGFMRVVLTVPEDLLIEACDRIVEFCNRHYVD